MNPHEKYLRRKRKLHAMGLTSNGKPWNPRPVFTFEQNLKRSQARFWSKVEKGPKCWTWKSGLNRQGYGKFKVGGRTIGAHRIAYQYVIGKIPRNALVCHTCDNPPCVNPAHLWIGDWASNMEDKVRKNRQAKGKFLSARVKIGLAKK